MKFGLSMFGLSPRYYPEIAAAAEATGFESVWIPEPLVLPAEVPPTWAGIMLLGRDAKLLGDDNRPKVAAYECGDADHQCNSGHVERLWGTDEVAQHMPILAQKLKHALRARFVHPNLALRGLLGHPVRDDRLQYKHHCRKSVEPAHGGHQREYADQ